MLFGYSTPPLGFLRKLVFSANSKEIEVTTNGDEDSTVRPPSLVIDYQNNDHWASPKNQNFSQYIQIHLVKKRIFATSYSYENLIISPERKVYNENWQFLGSNDGDQCS